MNWRENLSLLALTELSTLKDESTRALGEVRQNISSLIHRRLSRTISRSDYIAEWKASKSNEAELRRRVALLTREIGSRQMASLSEDAGSVPGDNYRTD
jgi:midasin (ATPase involved in ribosome maturation)